jgi:hypothetical protein
MVFIIRGIDGQRFNKNTIVSVAEHKAEKIHCNRLIQTNDPKVTMIHTLREIFQCTY